MTMILVISLWMFLVRNKICPKVDDSDEKYHPSLDDCKIIHYWMFKNIHNWMIIDDISLSIETNEQ